MRLRSSRQAGAATFITLLLAFVTACGGASTPAATPSAAEPATLKITDIEGREVELKAPVQRMYLGESRILYLAGLLDREKPLDRIVGWGTDLQSTDPDTINAYKAKFPEIEKIPEIGSFNQGAFSAESVIDLKPDVMVLTKSAYKSAQEIGAVETLEKVGIPTVVIDFREAPLKTTVPSVELLGKMMGKEDKAAEFATYYNEQLETIRSRVEKTTTKPVSFIYTAAGLNDCCSTFGNSNLGTLLEFAGGKNLGSELLPGPTGVVAEEKVLSSNPEHIIVTGSDWKNQPNKKPDAGYVNLGYEANPAESLKQLEALMAQPGWSGLKAVKDKQVHAVWHQFYTAPYNVFAAMQFAKWLHPEEFKDVDPTALYKEFHEKFLPVPYAGAFWISQ